MTHRLTALLLVVLFGAAHANVQAQGATDVWFRASAKPKDFRLAKLPWNAFSIELPKDWQLAPGHGGILLTAVEKTRGNQAAGAITLEQTRLVEPLSVNDIDAALAGLEASAARQRDPAGDNFEQQVKEANGRRVVMVQYTRPGLNGPDKVVMYAMPVGLVMYRLICVAPAALLASKYQDTFAHVASTFKPLT